MALSMHWLLDAPALTSRSDLNLKLFGIQSNKQPH